MPLQGPAPGQFEKVAANLLARADDTPPELLNRKAVLDLGSPDRFHFRGRWYIVEPTPFKTGLQIQAALIALSELKARGDGPDTAAEVGELLLKAMDLCWECTRPEEGARPAENPFLKAAPQEVGRILGFTFAAVIRQSAA
jgi:hypothetical protein